MENYNKCLLAFEYLQQCLYVLCETVLRKLHNAVLEELPKFQGNCNSCTFDTLLPYHQYKKTPCPHKTKRKCFCTKRPKSRTLCHNDGFCSKLYDKIILTHRYRDPLWKNSDPRKWKESFWKVAVCYINTQGYDNKESAIQTDVRGLLSIIINNLEFENGPYRLPINGEDNLFKKAREFNNDLHHRVKHVVDDDCTRAGINLVRSILEIPQLQNETFVQDIFRKFLNNRFIMELGATAMCGISSSSGGATETDITYTHSTNEAVGINYDEQTNEGDVEKSLAETGYGRVPTVPPVPPRYAEYTERNTRLRTYARWPHVRPDPETCANAGFFFTNQSDLLRCFQCGIGLKDISEDDDLLLEHVRFSGKCNFLLKHLGPEKLLAIKKQCPEQDEEIEIWRNISRSPWLQTYTARLLSFKNWPQDLSHTPETLADAGFFYVGDGDLVRCFMCDGGLRNWEDGDDPWIEHCRWFPNCLFVREKKGDEFITLIQASVESHSEENANAPSDSEDEEWSAYIERVELKDPVVRAVHDQHENTCLQMGYDLAEIDKAVTKLRVMGTIKPPIEEIIDMIEDIRQNTERHDDTKQNYGESPLEENQRLENLVTCMKCRKNSVNALFLPCTHHRLCMECSEQVNQCPVCNKIIRQKIRTYPA